MSKSKDKEKKVTEEDLPELEQYRLGQRVVAVLVGLGLTGVAVANTVLYALQGKADKAVASAGKAVDIFVKTLDPDAEADKKKGKEAEVSLSRKLLRIFGGAAVLGLGVATTVFKALRGDFTGAVSDIGGIVTLGTEIAYAIIPFFNSKVKKSSDNNSSVDSGSPAISKAPGIFSKLVSKVTAVINNTIDFTKSTADKVIKRMEKSPAGRVMLRIGEAAYDIATSKHVKVALQIAAAVMAVATATTPFGWAVAAISLGAVVGTGIKALLHAGGLRRLNEKKDALLSLQKEGAAQLRLLEQNPAMQKLQDKLQDAYSRSAQEKKPQRPPINVGREVLSALASSVVGGAAAILVEATAADPTTQAATAFILLGGISEEVKSNIKKEISRLDLKEEIWKLGGDSKSLGEVQAELLESKRRTTALTLLAADIEQNKSAENLEERFAYFMQKAAEVHKEPTAGDRIKGGFKGLIQDCNTLLFGDIRSGWRKLTGKKEDEPKSANALETPDAASVSPVKSTAKEVAATKEAEAGKDAHKSEVAAPVTGRETEKGEKHAGRVANIVQRIEAAQKSERAKKKLEAAGHTHKGHEVKMRVAALEAAQEAAGHIHKPRRQKAAGYSVNDVHVSAKKIAKEAGRHVIGDTHSKASRNHQQSPASERHRTG